MAQCLNHPHSISNRTIIDGDGQITTKDFVAIMCSPGQNSTEAEVQALINLLDVDGNGTIDFPEFLTAMAKKKVDSKNEGEIRETFKSLDKDADEYITSAELKQVTTDSGVHSL